MEIDIKKLLLTLVLRRRMIFFMIISCFIVGLVLSFVIPKRYRSTAKILPSAQDETNVSASLLSGLQQQFGLQVPGLSGLQTPFDLFVGILKSNTIASRVVRSCNLVKVYRVKNEGRAVSILIKQVEFKPLPEGVLVVAAETRSPNLSAQIANAYLAELDRFVKETNMTRGRNTRLFVEKRLHEVEADLRAAEDSLRVFQQRNKTVSLEEETKKAVEQYALLKARAVAKETEMNVLKTYATVDNPLYLSTRNELDEMNRRLREVEEGGGLSGFGVGFGVSFKSMPAVGEEYLRRLREVKIQEELYGLLMQQYEQAKILEARDTPIVSVLEAAAPSRIPSWPKKTIIIILFLILGVVLGIVVALFDEWWSNFKRRPQEYAEVQRIWGMVRSDFQFLIRRRNKTYDTQRKTRTPRS
jgi:uncharacterized protein involved in exopolysaccharide biosynthesis